MKFNSSVGGLVIALCITGHAIELVLGSGTNGQCQRTCQRFCDKVESATSLNTTGDLSVTKRSMCHRMCQPRKPDVQLGNGNESNALGQCTNTASCIPHSHCFKGHCRCDIGYDLHRKLGKCRILTECEHFGDHIISFENHCILLNDMLLIKNTSRDECVTKCINHTRCQTVDLMSVLFVHYCYLQNVTWYGVHHKFQLSTDSCVHFQKSCIW